MVEIRSSNPRESLEKILLQKFHSLLSKEVEVKAEEIDKLENLIKERCLTPENILVVLESTEELKDE